MSRSVWQEETRNDYCVCGFHMELGKNKKWSDFFFNIRENEKKQFMGSRMNVCLIWYFFFFCLTIELC